MVRIKRLLDSVSSVVALLCMGPVLAYLDRALLPLALLAIPLGFWCDRREHYPLPNWLATMIALTGMGFYAVQITRAEVAIRTLYRTLPPCDALCAAGYRRHGHQLADPAQPL